MGVSGNSQEIVCSAGIRWHLAPGAAGLLNSDSLELAAHQRAGNVQVIKSGPHRSVYRVELSNQHIFWKHCRIAGWRSWMRQCVRPPKARMEFDRAVALAARGISTIEPLAWGVDDRTFAGESYLITRELVGAISLTHYLEQIASPRERRDTAIALGRFFAQLHQAGVVHPDLHTGNILVVCRDAKPQFHLIDLHALQIGKPLSWCARRDNLVVFNRWFVNNASRADRCRFWRTYQAASVALVTFPPDAGTDLERRTRESNIVFRAGRDRRCDGTNRYFQKVRSAAASGYAVRDIDTTLLQTLLDDPDQPFRDPASIILKDSRTSTVAELAAPSTSGPHRLIWKRFQVKKPMSALLNRLRPSPALRSWRAAHVFLNRGLPTARPLLVLHRRSRLGPREGYLLCEKIEGGIDLLRALELLRNPAAKWNAIAMLARSIREMHELRLAHRDLKAANILWSRDRNAFHFIDLVGVSKQRRLSRSVRVKNLARLHVSLAQSPHWTRTDRLRFLSIYLCWALRGRAGWKEWWKLIDRASQEKIEQNRQRGRPVA